MKIQFSDHCLVKEFNFLIKHYRRSDPGLIVCLPVCVSPPPTPISLSSPLSSARITCGCTTTLDSDQTKKKSERARANYSLMSIVFHFLHTHTYTEHKSCSRGFHLYTTPHTHTVRLHLLTTACTMSYNNYEARCRVFFVL